MVASWLSLAPPGDMTPMPTELLLLSILALFAASLWIPYIIGATSQPTTEGAPDDFLRPPDLRHAPAWVHRAHRAHLNLIEQFVPFAVLVFLVDRLDGFTALTLWTSVAFLILRIAHAVGMISGRARMPVRPILFTLGWVCCLLMGYAAFVAEWG